jgi:thiol-disulfide isomerase/thioredoxin
MHTIKTNLIRYCLLPGIMLLASAVSFSQPNKVPPFQMIQANGKVFLAGNLPMGKPIVLIYFSQECDECRLLTKELLNRIKEFNNASIAMITNLPLEKVKQFVNEYHMEMFSNIFVGTEGNSFFEGKYYKVGKLPFATLYNKEGDLRKLYDKEISLEDLINNLRKL